MQKIELTRSINILCSARDGGTEVKPRFYRPGVYSVTSVHAEARIDRSVIFDADARQLLEMGIAVSVRDERPRHPPRIKRKRGASISK